MVNVRICVNIDIKELIIISILTFLVFLMDERYRALLTASLYLFFEIGVTSVIEASAELVEDALGICFERSGVMGGTIWAPMFSVSCAAKLLSDDCDVGSRSGIVSSKIA